MEQFPVFGDSSFRDTMAQMIYLNHASLSNPYPASVEAIQSFLTQWQHPGFKYSQAMLAHVNSIKTQLGQLLNHDAENFAIVPNTALGMSMILNAYPFEAGDEILFLDNEFPSNAAPYLAQGPRGVGVRQLDSHAFYQDPIGTIQSQISPKTRIFAISLVSYSSGYRVDLDQLSEYCQRHGLLLFVDGTQGVGVLPVDLRNTHVDVLVTSGYKWLRWPPVTAFAFIQPDLISQLTPLQAGWLTALNRPDICYPLQIEWPKNAQKFEQGGMQLFGLIGADTALKELLKIGVNQIQLELQRRTQLIVSKLKDRHIQTLIPYTPEHMAGIISFLVPGNNEALYDALVAEDIWITYRNNIFRLSPHYDTPLADIKRFFEVLDQFL